METGLKHQPVDDAIIEKIMKFAELHDIFTTKELFAKYPNNPELILRYGLNNLRIEGKLFMFGNKRGAYYSRNKEAGVKAIEKEQNTDLKDIVLGKIKSINGWFKSTDLNLSETYGHQNLLVILHTLYDEGKILIRGAKRWTEYRINDGTITQEQAERERFVDRSEKMQDKPKQDTQQNTPVGDNNLKNQILNFIKRNKVVTIPMLIEEFELQRYTIMPYIIELEKEEEIWHEGVKRGSKYIYKDVPMNEVEKIVSKLLEERKIEQRIDELSDFLLMDEATCISIGNDKNQKFKIKMFINGNKTKDVEFKDMSDGLSFIKNMTVATNG